VAHPITPEQAASLASSFTPNPVVTVAHGSGAAVPVPVIEGRVILDGGSQERTTLTMRVPIDLAPAGWDDLLVPDDARAVVTFGIGTGPAVRVATAWLDEVRVVRPDGYIDVTGYSRATRVQQAGFPFGDRRYTGTCVQVAQAIIKDALGFAVPVDVRGGLAGPQVSRETIFNGDPWQAVEDLMDAAGGEAYFNADDVLVMRPVPKANPPTSFRFHTGPGGTVVGYEVSLTRAPNVVRMEFQNPTTGADVVGVASATGKAAPSGPYGNFRRIEERTGVIAQADADRSAAEFLTRAGGLMRGITLTAVPHPGVEVGDAIEVVFVNGATETHRVTSVDLPLTPGEPMVLTTRSIPW
jgi:hypothetical protein